MSPVVRKLHPRGKVVAVLAFAFAVGASGYGVFTSGPLQVFSLRFPPGSTPLFVLIALVVAVVTIRRSLGEERCRRCDRPLALDRLGYAAEDGDRVADAVESGEASLLGSARRIEGAPVVVELRHCPGCRSVAVVKARRHRGADLTSEHILVGPEVAGWVAHLATGSSTDG
jgi:hypothetical protein